MQLPGKTSAFPQYQSCFSFLSNAEILSISDSALQVPAQNHLRGGFSVRFGDFRDRSVREQRARPANGE